MLIVLDTILLEQGLFLLTNNTIVFLVAILLFLTFKVISPLCDFCVPFCMIFCLGAEYFLALKSTRSS